MQTIMHQISQQAVAMATAASAGHHGQQQGTAGTGAQSADSPAPPPPQARVVITRPTLSPRIPQPMSTRGTTINLRATVPPSAGQQTNQVWTFKIHNCVLERPKTKVPFKESWWPYLQHLKKSWNLKNYLPHSYLNYIFQISNKIWHELSH